MIRLSHLFFTAILIFFLSCGGGGSGSGGNTAPNTNNPPSITEPDTEPLPTPTFTGDFTSNYASAVPSNASKQSYDDERFAVITGVVEDRDGNPLPGVEVSLKRYAEYGSTLTNAKGRFEIATEGGNTQILRYRKEGYTPLHRKVTVTNTQVSVAPTVTMLAVDSKSTEINLNNAVVQTHISTVVPGNGDNEQARSTTLVFDGVSNAHVTFPDGHSENFSKITVRATEFETPESMPSDLPPTSAFTYCGDLTIDEVNDEEATVTFNAPVIMYVNNFLGFDVGFNVPVGYYDRDKAKWIANQDGVVVELLDMDGDGVVDALDYTGDGQPDDFNDNNDTTDDAIGLQDPAVYKPNTTYWRTSITHFTPWDCNWPYGPGDDDVPPNNPEADGDNDGDKPTNCDGVGSYVSTGDQSFHEDIAIPGLSQKLWYASNTASRFKTVRIPASGDEVPSSLRSITVMMEVAGRTFTQTLPAAANQEAVFIWDKKDYRGLKFFGIAEAKISVGYNYQMLYLGRAGWSSGAAARNFGRIGSTSSFVRGRRDYTSWQKYSIGLNAFASVDQIGENWSFAAPYYLDRKNSMLYKGNGESEKITPSTVLKKITDIEDVKKIRVDLFGNLFILQSSQNKVLKLDKSGNLTTVVGTGEAGYNGDNKDAVYAQLNNPQDITFDNEGNLYIADYGNHRIRKVTPKGVITTIAGNGIGGSKGVTDDVVATETPVPYPVSVTIGPDNMLFFTSIYSTCKLTNANRTEVIGNTYGTSVKFVTDSTILYGGPSWNYYNRTDRQTRRWLSGIGNWSAGGSGDGGYAYYASLNAPQDIVQAKDGKFYIADYGNGRIRTVDTSWKISTLIGATASQTNDYRVTPELQKPISIALSTNNTLYIADAQSNAIYEVPLDINKDGSAFEHYEEGYLIKSGTAGHVFNETGRHTKDIDLKTGNTLTTYGYEAIEVPLASLLATKENPNPNVNGTVTDFYLTSITDRFNQRISIERDDEAKATAIISPDNDRTELNFANNVLNSIVYPDGATHQFSYDADGRMIQMIKPGGSLYNIDYNEAGEVVKFSDPVDGTWSYSNRSKLEDPNETQTWLTTTAEGNTRTASTLSSTTSVASTKVGYDGTQIESALSLDGTHATTNVCGITSTTTYANDIYTGQLSVDTSTVTMPSGLSQYFRTNKSYETSFDGLISKKTTLVDNNGYLSKSVYENNQNTITSPKGRSATISYDATTLLPKSVQAGSLYPIHYEYDDKGRVTKTAQGNRSSYYSYDDKGNLQRSIDADGDATSYRYDVMHRPTTVEYADSHNIQMLYNERSALKNLTTPTKGDFGFSYNKIDYVTEEKAPSGARTAYEYNKERQLTKMTMPSNKVINYTYTKTNLTQMSRPEGNTYYAYGCGSKLTSAYAGGEGVSYSYDGNLLTGFEYSGLLNEGVGFSYDNFFRVKEISYAGEQEASSYDADGLLISAGNFTINRDAVNGQAIFVSDEALKLIRSFNNYGELDQENYTVGNSSYAYKVLERTPSGKIKTKVEQLSGTSTLYDYTYDKRGRLTQVKQDNVIVESYEYDANGNRIAMSNSLTGVNARAFYNLDDTIDQFGQNSYKYNVDGYLETKTTPEGTTRYTYGSLGELKEVTLPNGDVISYQHNVNNQRVAKLKNGEVVEKYLWLNLTTLLATFDKDGNVKQRYEYADGRMPVAFTDENGDKFHIAYNQVGSPRAVMDVNGNVVKAVSYDSFGNIISDTNPSMQIAFGFAGGLYDVDTKLNRFGYRDYDAQSGKWTAKDPIGLAGGDTNILAYAGNDPVNFIDPTGEFVFLPYLIGAAINMGFEAYNQYQTGNFSLGRLTMAGLTGAYGGFGGSLLGALLRGGLANAANNAYQQLDNDCNKPFDRDLFWRSALYGAGGGSLGYAIGKAGKNLYRPYDIIGKPINKLPPPHYGPEGTAIGAAAGGILGNQ